MSRTGDALEALFDVLSAAAAAPSPKLPVPLQNEDLSSRMQEMGAGLAMYLNIWDDGEAEIEEVLGADEIENGIELTREVRVEFIVADGERVARRTAFEAGLEAIDDAIKADRTLGGKVDDARVLTPRRNGSGLWVDGLPAVLGAEVVVRLTYLSSRTF
jgi:hypothetical protein